MRCVLVIMFLISLCGYAACLSCLDNEGKDVPWWVTIKLPRLTHDRDERVAHGLGISYIDSNSSDDGELELFPKQMNDKESPVALIRSLSQLVGKKYASMSDIISTRRRGAGLLRENQISFFMYNDQTEDKNAPISYGHSKGLIAFDGKSGIWILHSTPKFPNTSERTDFYFPEHETTYAQSFMCIALSRKDLNRVGDQLKHVRPWVYFDEFSQEHKKALPSISDIINKKVRIDKIGSSNVIHGLKAVGGTQTDFSYMVKNSRWNRRFWTDLVSETLEDDMIVQSWIRGSSEGPVCSPYKVVDVIELSMNRPPGEEEEGGIHQSISWKWTESQDHSKWGVGLDESKSWVCFGDLNRMTTQRHRGGGALCWRSLAVWNRLKLAIKKNQQCLVQ